MAILRVGLGVLRSRPFHEQVIVTVIAVAALIRLAKENEARTRERLTAWDKRQRLRSERGTKARPA
jgi:hypothetical protein